LQIYAGRLFRTRDPWMAKDRSPNVILVDDAYTIVIIIVIIIIIVDLKQQNKKG